MISTESFWAALLCGVSLALVADLFCLAVIARISRRYDLDPPDAAVVSMLKRIAIFNSVPLACFVSYFGTRLVFYDDGSVRSVGLVAYASGGYLLALIGLALPAISAAVLVYYRSQDSGSGR